MIDKKGTGKVVRDGNIIRVTVAGWITESLTEQVQKELECELQKADQSCILYDSTAMTDPSLTLVFLMQSFHERHHDCISKSAIIVPDLGYRSAFLARLAFGKDATRYRVFYEQRDEAEAWLQS